MRTFALILLVGAISLHAEPIALQSFTVPSDPPQKFVITVDLANYQSYAVPDSVIPNLLLPPKEACQRVKLAWQAQFPNDTISSLVPQVVVREVGGGYLAYYLINVTASAAGGSRQLNVAVMPNGDVILPRELK